MMKNEMNEIRVSRPKKIEVTERNIVVIILLSTSWKAM